MLKKFFFLLVFLANKQRVRAEASSLEHFSLLMLEIAIWFIDLLGLRVLSSISVPILQPHQPKMVEKLFQDTKHRLIIFALSLCKGYFCHLNI